MRGRFNAPYSGRRRTWVPGWRENPAVLRRLSPRASPEGRARLADETVIHMAEAASRGDYDGIACAARRLVRLTQHDGLSPQATHRLALIVEDLADNVLGGECRGLE